MASSLRSPRSPRLRKRRVMILEQAPEEHRFVRKQGGECQAALAQGLLSTAQASVCVSSEEAEPVLQPFQPVRDGPRKLDIPQCLFPRLLLQRSRGEQGKRLHSTLVIPLFPEKIQRPHQVSHPLFGLCKLAHPQDSQVAQVGRLDVGSAPLTRKQDAPRGEGWRPAQTDRAEYGQPPASSAHRLRPPCLPTRESRPAPARRESSRGVGCR